MGSEIRKSEASSALKARSLQPHTCSQMGFHRHGPRAGRNYFFKSLMTQAHPKQRTYTVASGATAPLCIRTLSSSLRVQVPNHKASTQNHNYDSQYGNPKYPIARYFAPSAHRIEARARVEVPGPEVARARGSGKGGVPGKALGSV